MLRFKKDIDRNGVIANGNVVKRQNGVDSTQPTQSHELKGNVSFQTKIATPEVHCSVECVKPQIKRKSISLINVIGHFFRGMIIDIPLMLIFALYASSVILHTVTVDYYIPQINLMKWSRTRQVKELTYYHRQCRDEDVTTNATEDLVISPEMSSQECMDHMLTHGVSIYPNLLSPETAAAARAYILERNTLEENWGVISNKQRWSFGIDVNSHPSIQKALKEIGSNKQLTEALRRIAGRNPAVIEFTGITAAYGAADQRWHKDVVPRGSAFKYSRNFVPSYSLFIPLQDTTAAMGSTEICPGTHMCTSDTYDPCEKKGMFVSGKIGSWKMGHGALVNQQLYHRGTAHRDPNGPERVLFILTFAARPRFGKNQLESRLIGFEGSYSLRWDQWGHTLEDFSHPEKHMIEPWRKLRAFGLYKPARRDWGWDYITVASMRIANEDTSYTPEDLETFVEQGGYSFIPKILKVKLEDDDDWTDYLLKTIESVMNGLKTLNIRVMTLYLGVLVMLACINWLFGFRKNGSFFRSALCRLLITHGLVLILAFMASRRINSRQWAENIRLKKAFRGYKEPTQDKQGATLPNELDVLKVDRFQSSYLASYNRVLDLQHPGNRNYHQIVNFNSINYHNLPPSLQRDVASHIVSECRAIHLGRFLRQNSEAKWVVMSEKESLAKVHVDLTKASHSTFDFLLTQLEYFRSELAAGVWRETALHKHHVSDFIDKLERLVIGGFPLTPKPSSLASNVVRSGRPLSPSLMSFKPATPIYISKLKVIERERIIPSPLPPQKEITPPWRSAWIQEGDTVDALYEGTSDGKFFL
jgi:hypothetical protein